MEVYVCKSCSALIPKLRYPRAYKQKGEYHCGTCGGLINESHKQDLSEAEIQEVKIKSKKYVRATIAAFDGFLWFIVIFGVLIFIMVKYLPTPF